MTGLLAAARAVLDQVEPNPFPVDSPQWHAFEGYFENAMEADSAEWVSESTPEAIFDGCMAHAEAEADAEEA